MVFQVACILAIALGTVSVSSHNAHSSQHVSRHNGHEHAVHIPKHEHGHDHIDFHAHPKYEYGYKINDPHTGDYKSQHEDRDGDVVKGYYEFKQPDGTIRRVEYKSDKHTGFHATVKHSTEHRPPLHHNNF